MSGMLTGYAAYVLAGSANAEVVFSVFVANTQTCVCTSPSLILLAIHAQCTYMFLDHHIKYKSELERSI